MFPSLARPLSLGFACLAPAALAAPLGLPPAFPASPARARRASGSAPALSPAPRPLIGSLLFRGGARRRSLGACLPRFASLAVGGKLVPALPPRFALRSVGDLAREGGCVRSLAPRRCPYYKPLGEGGKGYTSGFAALAPRPPRAFFVASGFGGFLSAF